MRKDVGVISSKQIKEHRGHEERFIKSISIFLADAKISLYSSSYILVIINEIGKKCIASIKKEIPGAVWDYIHIIDGLK